MKMSRSLVARTYPCRFTAIPPTTANSTFAAANAARSEICFSFIEVYPTHLVQAFCKFRHSGQPLGHALSAPIEALLRPRLFMGKFSRRKWVRDPSRILVHRRLRFATIFSTGRVIQSPG